MMGELYYENQSGTFAVSHRVALSHHMPLSHFHSTYEIYCLLSGSREIFIKDRTIEIQEGDVVIIPPNILHRTKNAERPRHERLIVNIHESHMVAADGSHRGILEPLYDNEYLVISSSPQVQPIVEGLAETIIREVKDKKPGFELYVQTLVMQLLILLCRYVKTNSAAPFASISPMHDRISEIVRYINQHYMEDLSLHTLAEMFYVSPYYLSRSFKEVTGFTFVEYLNSVRVKEAKKLLEGSSLKVNQICREVGFGSVTHFGRVFKMITGHAPLYYRRTNTR